MKGSEFIARVRRIGRDRRRSPFEPRPGKGSHGRLYYGERYTTVKDRKKELGKGLLRTMIEQLGLDPEDF